jgi:hypothetical protein
MSRLERMTHTDLFADVNLHSRLVLQRTGLALHVHHCEGLSKPTFVEVVAEGQFVEYQGEPFGPTWSTHWFKFEVAAEQQKSGQAAYLEWRAECEGLLYTEGGELIAAVSEHRPHALLPKPGKYFMVKHDSLSLQPFRRLPAMACLAQARGA